MKCCKKKENTNWFCVACKTFVHKSCWKRSNNDFEILTESTIFCSRKCKETANDNDTDNIIDVLKQIITELKVEVEEKDNFIARLKRQSTSASEVAFNHESELVADLEKKDIDIKDLKQQIKVMSDQLLNYQGKVFSSVGVQTLNSIAHNCTQTII